MRLPGKSILILLAMTFAVATGVRAADATKPKPSKPDMATAVNSSDLQKLIQQFATRRDSMLADRQALLNQLRNATAEQRKAILEKMESQQKELLEAQRALGKQIRDDMRKLRMSLPGPGRH